MMQDPNTTVMAEDLTDDRKIAVHPHMHFQTGYPSDKLLRLSK